ncbi:MerR family transcriptional regulator [Deinococcus sonorensis]|uniref:MerR family transcriptional regulator n=2 Tax=Deinococcus sonorensis TaxID=309891 RepID=A0AAU7U8X1_9DEIO
MPELMPSELSIQEAARSTGLSPDTLRYYERIGLLEPVSRHSSGHRRYHPQDLHRVGFLSCLRATGMSIRQLQAFTALASEGPHTVDARLALLEAHKAQVRARIAELEHALSTIDHKITYYRSTGGHA